MIFIPSGIVLPDVNRALEVHAVDIAQVAGVDQSFDLENGGCDAALQADDSATVVLLCELHHFKGLRGGGGEWPFAVDVFAGVEGREGDGVVGVGSGGDDYEVDVGVCGEVGVG